MSPTQEIVTYLLDEGFRVTSRTVERDLTKLSTVFGYSFEEDGRSYRWFWPPGFKTIDIPSMDASTALAFSLAEKHLSHLIPPSALDLLNSYFQRANEILDATSCTVLSDWRDKVHVIGVGPRLKPPVTKKNVQRIVYEALLEERRLEVVYRPRGRATCKQYEFSPLALVTREGVHYLVGPLWFYDDVVQLALHRIQDVSKTKKAAHVPVHFDIKRYINEAGEFSYPTGQGRIKLEALFDRSVATHLKERPINPNQTVSDHDSHWVRLRATVLDTEDLTWWLLGFGPNVQVIRPVNLKRRIARLTQKAADLYKT